MNKLLIAVLATLATSQAYADTPKHTGRLETCLSAVTAKYPGNIVSVEAEIENNKAIYEFDVKTKDGKEWEVECDAKTGKLTEAEEEVDAKDPRFTAIAKISLDEAKKIALAAKPGEVIESETSIEANGNASYEFDIKGKDGKEWEVEVDAATGKIVEIEQEVYQIGLD